MYISEALLIRRPRGPLGEESIYTSGCPVDGWGCAGYCDRLCDGLASEFPPLLIGRGDGSGVAVRLAYLGVPGKIGVVTPG